MAVYRRWWTDRRTDRPCSIEAINDGKRSKRATKKKNPYDDDIPQHSFANQWQKKTTLELHNTYSRGRSTHSCLFVFFSHWLLTKGIQCVSVRDVRNVCIHIDMFARSRVLSNSTTIYWWLLFATPYVI